VNHPHPIRYVLAAPSIELKNEWCLEFERVLAELHEAEAKHEEAVRKIASKKAHVAKSLISQSLMQHASVNLSGENCKSILRENRQTANVGGNSGSYKSKTADATTVRAYAEHMALAKMSPQERWETAKKVEDVQNWEKLNKKQELQKQLNEDQKKLKEEENRLKKKEIKQQLNNLNQGHVRNYREALAQYKQLHQDSTHL